MNMVISSMNMPPKIGIAIGTIRSEPRPVEVITGNKASKVVAVVISITLHELGHGAAALWQGDETPRLLGHMTLDPRAHMPPISWGLLLLVGIAYGLMPVNPSRFRSKHGDALVAFAGPAVNLILAALAAPGEVVVCYAT